LKVDVDQTSSHQEVFMVEKRLLVPDRVRHPPEEGFSWVDRRFLRDHAASLGRDAILLYFFLAAVSDQSGLSFWSDTATAARTRLDKNAVLTGREELVRRNLVAHERPLTQVLSLPKPEARSSSEPVSIATLLPACLRPKGSSP
jgi:hypothetical protein